MDIKRLKYFISVIDKGSIGRAANGANLAQPAMSQHMAAIEADLGVKLLMRSPQGVTPTPAGLHFYRSSHAIVRRFEDAVRETVMIAERNSGTITVAIPTSMSGMLGSALLDLLMESFPTIRIRLLEGMSGHLMELALNGRVDMVFSFVDASISGLDVRPLLVEEMFLVEPPTASDAPTVTLEEVADTPLVLPGPEHGLRKIVENGLARIGREPNIVLELDSHPLTLDLVRRGVASTVMSWAGMTARTATVDLKCKHIVSPSLVRPVAMCLSENALTIDRIDEAADAIETLIRSLVETGKWKGVQFADSAKKLKYPESV